MHELDKAAVSSSPKLAEKATRLVATDLTGLVFPSIPAALSRVLDLGIEAAPEEACGVLVNETTGVRVIQLQNRSETPTREYRIDRETLRTLALKPDRWTHVAIWHTHPGGEVGPSAGDLEYKIPTVTYVVVTVPTGEVRWF